MILTSASGIGSACTRAATASGPAAPPTFAAAGTGANALGDPTPSYPANVSGDLFVLHAYVETDTITPPAGWSTQASIVNGAISHYVFTRDARATGSDSGTVTVVTSGSNLCIARIYGFRTVAVANFIESVTDTTATNGTCPGPTVAAGGVNRLGVFLVVSNGGVSGMASCTGESGGDWTEAVAEQTSGLGGGIQLQTASLSAGGTISGGSAAVNGTNAIGVGFALVGV